MAVSLSPVAGGNCHRRRTMLGWWGLRRGSMYIVPDGLDDVGVPWRVTVGIIECKSVLKLRFRAILCNAYALKNGVENNTS